MPQHTAHIALGANVGDRERSIRDAVDHMNADADITVARVSSLFENPAVGGPPDSPAFLNAAARLVTTLSPQQLLERMLDVEHRMGRLRRTRWEPRVIDLDLILYGDEVIDTPTLRVPHPLMHERRFVLAPLAEIEPEVVHPLNRRTVREMLAELADTPPKGRSTS